jgi:hypothetical protein
MGGERECGWIIMMRIHACVKKTPYTKKQKYMER